MPTVRRRFLDLDYGQIHYRTARGDRPAGEGGPAPVILLHSAAQSSAMLSDLVAALGETRQVIAPDLPGCGDTAALPDKPTVSVEDLADWLAGTLGRLGIEQADVHGLHLGARIGVDLSLRYPGLVRRLIVDGNGFYSGELGAAMLANVAPELKPDLDGLYLMRAWHYIRDYYQFFPLFQRGAENVRGGGLPAPAVIHEKLMEVLRNGQTYFRPYHAAFGYPMEERLPKVTVPTLITAARDDNVFEHLDRSHALLPGAEKAATAGILSAKAARETATVFAGFLDR